MRSSRLAHVLAGAAALSLSLFGQQFPPSGGSGTGAPNAASPALGSPGTQINIAHTFTTEARDKALVQCYTSANALITDSFTKAYPDASTIRVTFGVSQAAGSYCNANATGTGATGATGASGASLTASNTGSSGIGLFKQKTGGLDLEFYRIASANNYLVIDLNGTDYARLTVNLANFPLANGSQFGFLSAADHATFSAKYGAGASPSFGNLTLSGNLTRTGITDGCATWASGVLSSTGTACGSGGGGGGGEVSLTADVGGGLSLRGSTPKTGSTHNLRTLAATGPLTVSQTTDLITFAMPQAGSGQSGFLSGNDWAAFNAKQAALGFTPAPQTSGTGMLKGNGTGGFAAAIADTDFASAARGVTNGNTHDHDGGGDGGIISYLNLSNRPTLGDAAGKNTGTGSGDVAVGNHLHTGIYQLLDSDLTQLAALECGDDQLPKKTAGVWACRADEGSGGEGTSAPNLPFPFTLQTSVTLTHNANTLATLTQCYDSNNKKIEPYELTRGLTANTVTFLSATTGGCVVNLSGGGGGGASGVAVMKNGSLVGTFTTLNIIESTNSTIGVTDAGSGQGDIQFASSGSSTPAAVPFSKDYNVRDPLVADTGNYFVTFPVAATILRVGCSTNTGATVTIQLDERATATPNTAGVNVLPSPLVCDGNTEVVTSGFSNASIAADVPLNLQITAVSSGTVPTRVHVYVVAQAQ